MRRALAVAAMLLGAAARADDYGRSLAEAEREAAAGRWQEAARLLEAPARAYPQDYPVQLARAWYLFQSGDPTLAADAYRRAQALAPEAVDPVLGLGWSAQRTGDVAEARGRFEEVLRRSPGQASAQEGLMLLGAESGATLWLGGAYAGSSASGRPALYSGSAAVDAHLADRITLGAFYRALGTQTSFAGGRGRGAAATPMQSEVHASAGWRGAGWTAALHGAWIEESASGSGSARTVHAEGGWTAGASAWGRVLPRLELDGAVLRTAYGSGLALQWQAAAGLRLGERLLLRAGARGQAAPEGRGLAGLASLELRGRWSAWLVGEVGTQRRPVDLSARAIYPLAAPLRWAARAGLGFPLGGAFSGLAAVDLESWGESAPGSADARSTWRGTAGLRWTF